MGHLLLTSNDISPRQNFLFTIPDFPLIFYDRGNPARIQPHFHVPQIFFLISSDFFVSLLSFFGSELATILEHIQLHSFSCYN